MSHFAMLVIGANVDAQMAPYHEYECTGYNDQYVQDIDVTEDIRREWEEATVTRARLLDGTLVHTHDAMFYRNATDEERALIMADPLHMKPETPKNSQHDSDGNCKVFDP